MSSQHSEIMRRARRSALVALSVSGLLLAGCRGIPTKSERQARDQLADLRTVYPPRGAASLPTLDQNSTLATLLSYAMLNRPQVQAAYYDYVAAVERTTIERSLPDPRLTFEMDIQDVVMAVMPGLMFEVPWVKRLRTAADEAAAESRGLYFAFETAVLQAAYEVKRPYFQLYFLNDRIRINQDNLRLLGEVEQNALARVQSGQATLQDVLRAQIEQERLRTEIENLEDSRKPLLAQLKASLGLRHEEPDPPVPSSFEPTSLDLNGDALVAAALARNPRLKQMQAEVQMAEIGIRMAHLSRLPDFSLGAEADIKASPTMWRPSVGVTLPVWRDKIAAQIALAQARKGAAEARLNGEEIQLAVEVADKSFMYREATRNLKLLTESLLPKAKQSLQIARAGYVSGQTGFIDLLDAERALLEFEVAEVDARTRRELALTELSLMVVGIQPADAPVIPGGTLVREPIQVRPK